MISDGDKEPRALEEALGHETIRRRAVSGAAFIAGRGVALLLLAGVANAVIARELAPAKFGLIAFGTAIMVFASAFSDGGLGGALIRSAVPVDEATLRSVLGLQLAVTSVMFAGISLAGLAFFGLAGQLTALMAFALPVDSLDTPARIMLERSLSYRTLARVEVVQAAIYYGFAVTAVAAGLGVWGLAAATVVRSIGGVSLVFRARPDLFFRPSFDFRRVRSLLRFGIAFQGANIVNVVRDQGLNIGIGAIAGAGSLGIWTLARRLLELPLLLFQTLWRVSFPATSQLMRLEADLRPVVEKGVAMTSIGSGLLLVPIAAGAPGLVPAVFGHRWHEVGIVVTISCAALIVSGPVSVATGGFLYASGAAADVLTATVWHTVAWLAVGLALLPVLGVPGIAIGLLVGSSIDALLLARATWKHTSVRLFSAVLASTTAGLVGGAVGVALALLMARDAASGALAAAVGEAAYVALLFVLDRRRSLDLVAIARRAARDAVTVESSPA
jgi:O-antigen/teichoic acid export membrane protein